MYTPCVVHVMSFVYTGNFCFLLLQVKCKMSGLAHRMPEGHLFNQVCTVNPIREMSLF